VLSEKDLDLIVEIRTEEIEFLARMPVVHVGVGHRYETDSPGDKRRDRLPVCGQTRHDDGWDEACANRQSPAKIAVLAAEARQSGMRPTRCEARRRDRSRFDSTQVPQNGPPCLRAVPLSGSGRDRGAAGAPYPARAPNPYPVRRRSAQVSHL
jgi:hypothetical protein